MKRLAARSLALAVFVSLTVSAAQNAPKSSVIDSDQLLLDLKTLSADDMQGRQVGTPGGEKARAYVIERFKASGIAAFGASYEAPFTFTRRNTEVRGVNVLGQIKGTGGFPRYIVVSAHYDHIGVQGGVVNNGADDNASGTAALFAIAKYFSAHKPVNSILVAAFDAEEANLRGSQAFVKQPPVAANLLSIDLNADMIGRDPNDKLFVVGTALQPFLKPHVEAIAAKAPVKLLIGHEDPRQRNDDWTQDSDHYSFMQAKIPALYFGVEDEDQHHKPTDDYETMTYPFYVKAVETLVQAVQYFDKNLDAIDKARGAAGVTESPVFSSSGGPFVPDESSATATQTPSTESPVEMSIPSGKVSGTLLVPAGAGKKPVVLIVAGSGPTDRNGNSIAGVTANSYRLLAEALAADGIASLRYDKRGVALSVLTGVKESDLRFEDFVSDAVQWVKQLRADSRFSTVTVAGHSEGSLIGMIAAREGGANAFVSLSGIAKPAAAALRDQLRPQIGLMPAVWDGSEAILASLEAGKIMDPLPPAITAIPQLASLFRLSVQPYLISWFKYSGATEITKLKVPVAIIQGTTDIQVSVEEAKALAAARPDAKLVIIDGMNHLLKSSPADRAANIATYTNPALPIVPDVTKTITALVKGLK